MDQLFGILAFGVAAFLAGVITGLKGKTLSKLLTNGTVIAAIISIFGIWLNSWLERPPPKPETSVTALDKDVTPENESVEVEVTNVGSRNAYITGIFLEYWDPKGIDVGNRVAMLEPGTTTWVQKTVTPGGSYSKTVKAEDVKDRIKNNFKPARHECYLIVHIHFGVYGRSISEKLGRTIGNDKYTLLQPLCEKVLNTGDRTR